MTSRSAGGHVLARRALAAALAIAVVAGLPPGVAGRDPGPGTPPGVVSDPAVTPDPATTDPAVTPDPAAPRDATSAPAAASAAEPPPAGGPPPDLRPSRVSPGDAPSQMYLDTVANEHRSFHFTPGGRVSVGFRPRADDRWPVDGHLPRELPAGRATGDEMAGSPAATPAPPVAPTPVPPGQPKESPPDASPSPDGPPHGSPSPEPSTGAAADPTPAAPMDAPPDQSPIPAEGAAYVVPGEAADIEPTATGMRREVYGFLPYWQVSDPDTRLDFSILTHLAYFSLGADGSGNLKKRNSDGTLTTGWAGWTSSKMTSIINAAHLKRSRVTLTLSVFAWTSGQVTVQKALLGSATARLNLARQAVAAVRDRGADGINLDFEPLVSGYEDEFVALVRTIRAELDKMAPGYHLSFDTLGSPGNYPLEQALAPGGADAVFVMGYDYRTASAGYAGSIDPLAGPAYDLSDTVRTYTARVPASRVILGIPYYGRAWSTVSDAVHARTQTGAKYGYSSAVNYSIAADYAAKHGRRYDSREVAAWVAYKKQSCTSTYGCVTTWRQIYYDDAATLKARYDLVNRAGLRGTGIWALGYDGTRRELYQALADKFLNDTTPPLAGIVGFDTAARSDLGFTVRWTAADDWSGIASYDVQASVDGGAWTGWLLGTTATSATYLGVDNTGYAFRVRARDGKGNLSAWNVSSVYAAAPPLAKGGFVRVVADTLNLRSAPATGATRLDTAAAGDALAITDGPVSSDGFTWYEVTGPVSTWGPVADVQANLWVAVAGSGSTLAVARRAPNATATSAGIRSVGFSGAGSASLGTSPAAAAARSFSPNGDGSRDLLPISWNNRRALDALALRVYALDGTLLGSRTLDATTAGAQATTWDGSAGGSSVPDGTYVLQLAGSAGGVPYAWPAATPTAAGLAAQVAVTVDRTPPTLTAATLSSTRLSPNGDGRLDSVSVTGSASSDAVRWDLVATPAGGAAPARRIAGSGRTVKASWDGRADDGSRAPDGVYALSLRFFDAAGNPATQTWSVTLDTIPATVGLRASAASFSPDGDGATDTTRLTWSASERVTGWVRILRGTTLVRRWSIGGTSGALTWNGRDAAGRVVRDGRYTAQVVGTDTFGIAVSRTTPVTVDRTVGFLRWSASAFYPQDGDSLAARATVFVRVARSARLTLRILDATGREVRRPWSSRSVAAGTAAWAWNGRTGAGTWAPPGQYVAEITAVSSLGTTVLRRSVVADAFVATPSSLAPRAGTRFSVTFRTVEPLAVTPTASFRQTGRSSVCMSITRLSSTTWRASVTVAAGAPGPALVTLAGRDTRGGRNRATLTVTVP